MNMEKSYKDLVASEMEAIMKEVKETGVTAYAPVSSSRAYNAGATVGELAYIDAKLALAKRGVIRFDYYGKY